VTAGPVTGRHSGRSAQREADVTAADGSATLGRA
jgi:hypothetical protein